MIPNITLIDGYSNKHKIGKKPPSEYISMFSEDNSQLENTLRSHLINDIVDFGIESNDYNMFINKRASEISNALSKKLNLV